MTHRPPRSRPSAAPGAGAGTAMRALSLALLVAVTACFSNRPVFGGRGGVQETFNVQAQVVSWLVRNYQSSESLGTAKAFCVVAADLGGNQLIALSMVTRPTDYDPPARLMGRLRSRDPAVLPISRCRRDDELVERLVDGDDRAVVVGVGYPFWVTANLARLQVVVRESANVSYSYGCSIERGREGWAVRNCIRRL